MKRVINYILGVVSLIAAVFFFIDGDIVWGVIALIVGALLIYFGIRGTKETPAESSEPPAPTPPSEPTA